MSAWIVVQSSVRSAINVIPSTAIRSRCVMTDGPDVKALAWDILTEEVAKAHKTIFHSKIVGDVEIAMAYSLKEARHKVKKNG